MNIDDALAKHAKWLRDGEWCCTNHAVELLRVLAAEVERMQGRLDLARRALGMDGA